MNTALAWDEIPPSLQGAACPLATRRDEGEREDAPDRILCRRRHRWHRLAHLHSADREGQDPVSDWKVISY